MTDDVRDIPPALSEDEWARHRQLLTVPRFAHENGTSQHLVIDRLMRGEVGSDVRDLATIIALANAAMNDEDPRKLTREHVRALRLWLESTRDQVHNTETERDVDLLDDLADVVDSYLPPTAT